MGKTDSLSPFPKKKKEDCMKKIELKESSQWEELVQKSYENEVVIFKHSSRCGISSMVLRQFEKRMSKKVPQCDYFFVDILRNRQISDLVQQKTSVRHESPQAILLDKGVVKEHSSHGGILMMTLFSN